MSARSLAHPFITYVSHRHASIQQSATCCQSPGPSSLRAAGLLHASHPPCCLHVHQPARMRSLAQPLSRAFAHQQAALCSRVVVFGYAASIGNDRIAQCMTCKVASVPWPHCHASHELLAHWPPSERWAAHCQCLVRLAEACRLVACCWHRSHRLICTPTAASSAADQLLHLAAACWQSSRSSTARLREHTTLDHSSACCGC